jgi:hypothetical protein
MILPKGYLVNCPHCGCSLYRLSKDISWHDAPIATLQFIVAIYPQPTIEPTSNKFQKCFKCKEDFRFIDLIGTQFSGGKI